MRLQRLLLEDFRGFTGEHSFDLAPNTLLLTGPNGQGKTSFLDAILWALTGAIPRLEASDRDLVSVYSDSGRARVELVLSGDHEIRITRNTDGKEQTVSYSAAEGVLEGIQADAALVTLLWPRASRTGESMITLAQALTRSIYLQQDVVRHFIETDEQERFDTFAELVGVGRVSDLQTTLEAEKRQWTRRTNEKEAEGEREARDRLDRLAEEKERLASLQAGFDPVDEEDWLAWWKDLRHLGVSIHSTPMPDSVEAPSSLDGALKSIAAARAATSRRLQRAERLEEDILSRAPEDAPPDVAALDAVVERLRGELATSREQLQEAREQASAQRRQWIEKRETSKELASLAQLALRHLDERCPVCAQQYDDEKTRAHLRSLIEAAGSSAEEGEPKVGAVSTLAVSVELLEKKLLEAEGQATSARSRLREQEEWQRELNSRLADLGIEADEELDVEGQLPRVINSQSDRQRQLDELEKLGEGIGVRLAAARELGRRHEIEEEIAELQKQIANQQEERTRRVQTGDLAQMIIEGTRDAATEIVAGSLERIEPVLQGIYSRIDPHPTFRMTELASEMRSARGRLNPRLQDPLFSGRDLPDPAKLLSSSQVNSLAVAVFLAFNLSMPAPPLETVMLDDPIQSLDDINLLGLVDLLRRVGSKRQLIVSTHDKRLGGLLQRKLRPPGPEQRTSVVRFSGWNRLGPVVEQFDVPYEEAFSIVA